jgi:catechol 2,3-dioxygenase-like lactoylglutathione lyase family enzyme
MSLIQGIAHVNLTVPAGTLEAAAEFYEGVLGLKRVPVPVLQKDILAWYASSLPVLLKLPF